MMGFVALAAIVCLGVSAWHLSSLSARLRSRDQTLRRLLSHLDHCQCPKSQLPPLAAELTANRPLERIRGIFSIGRGEAK